MSVDGRFEFKALPGYFVQDDTETEDGGYDFATPTNNFGLHRHIHWANLTQILHDFNAAAKSRGEGKQYKLLYLARHGEGEHNVAEAKYGKEAWDDYWSKLETDGTLNWADAHLTPTGKEQARKVNEVLKFQFAEKDMPVPELYWSSPMWRCLQTAELSWAELPTADKSSHGRGGRVFVIKEMLREVIGVHTCDRRSGRSVIEQGFGLPKWRFEEGFGEADALWKADERESWAEIDVRMRGVLGQLFEGVDGGNEAEVVSFTAHSGAVASLLRVLGHRLWRLGTGGVIPVLVEATRVQ